MNMPGAQAGEVLASVNPFEMFSSIDYLVLISSSSEIAYEWGLNHFLQVGSKVIWMVRGEFSHEFLWTSSRESGYSRWTYFFPWVLHFSAFIAWLILYCVSPCSWTTFFLDTRFIAHALIMETLILGIGSGQWNSQDDWTGRNLVAKMRKVVQPRGRLTTGKWRTFAEFHHNPSRGIVSCGVSFFSIYLSTASGKIHNGQYSCWVRAVSQDWHSEQCWSGLRDRGNGRSTGTVARVFGLVGFYFDFRLFQEFDELGHVFRLIVEAIFVFVRESQAGPKCEDYGIY